ncbi:eukaryotic translation initiation factor 2 beta [Hysterangium stoloniferum]|nr:eukaryotic translation initiation factor 2 beta [Hysterangium stoloniferum]
MDEPLFDPSLRKRKKKTVAFSEDPLGADADPTTPAPPTEAGDATPTVHEQMVQNGGTGVETGTGAERAQKEDDDFKAMFGDMKKKKKKKEIPADLPEDTATQTPPEPAVGEDLDFSDLKKKKKKTSKKPAFDLEAFEKELGDTGTAQGNDDGEDGAGGLGDDVDLGDDPFAVQHDAGAGAGVESGKEAWVGSDRDYTYSELLQRFFTLLHASNPGFVAGSGKRYTIAPPAIQREGTKKSVFSNVTDICKRMHRQPDHVIQFLFSELGTTGSVDGAGRLVIKGRFQQKQIENVLRRYIVEYVTCKTCKSPDTLLEKENRIDFVSCQSCGSRRSVSAIKSGFKAQVGKRKKAA